MRARKKPTTKKQIPYGAVALLWANGKTVSEISDQMGWTEPKSKFPYSYAYGVLKTLRKGVSLGLITIRINKKRENAQQGRSYSASCPFCGAPRHIKC